MITEHEVGRRKAYLEITSDDERRLHDAHSHLVTHAKEIIDRFYEYLLSHDHTRAMLADPARLARLKELQTRYFDELTAGTYDAAYFENRLKVGQAHNRVGLSPQWYLGAYNKYLTIVSDVLSRSFGRDYERYFQTMTSLTKIINLDMSLAIDAYHESAQQARRQLTDMIVHDLQNPLAGITAFMQHLQSNASLGESARGALVEALRRCDDLGQMILNVLHVSRAEEGRLQTYIENVDLSLLARESAESFRLAAEHDGRSLVVEAPAPVPARTDQSLVRRVILNLIRNALRHTPKGTRIVVRAEPGRVSVSDDGPGIPADVQPLLFERFGAARLRDAGLRVDSGLGLPFCRVATQAVGAKIAVESDGKRGTTFVVSFP